MRARPRKNITASGRVGVLPYSVEGKIRGKKLVLLPSRHLLSSMYFWGRVGYRGKTGKGKPRWEVGVGNPPILRNKRFFHDPRNGPTDLTGALTHSRSPDGGRERTGTESLNEGTSLQWKRT